MTIESTRPDIDVETAIARVLEAENEAQADAKRCREEAEAIRERAEAAVRALAARTDARLIRIRQRMRANALVEVERLDSAAVALPGQGAVQIDAIDAAAERIARELIGSAP